MPNLRQQLARAVGLGDVLDYQEQRPKDLGFVFGEHNGPQDAARHVLGSYALSNKISSPLAALLTTAYEGFGKVTGEPSNENSMDMHNNALGRSLASRFKDPADAERALQTLMDYAAKYDLWNKQIDNVPTWLPKNQQDKGY